MSAQPQLLYHYTNQAGLLGILKYKKLWATHIHFLNDTKEFWHNVENTKRALQSRIAKSLSDFEKITLEALLTHTGSIESTMTYVTSFSARRDSLSLWRGYVGNQPGFALGFDIAALRRLAGNLTARLEPCLYHQAEQERQIDALISETLENDFFPIPDDTLFDPSPFPRYKDDTVGKIVHRINIAAPLHKHEAFIDEQEWRFVYSPNLPLPTVQFRAGQSMLIPYVEIDLLEQNVMSCLKEIVIGPCPSPEFSNYSLMGLLTLTEGLPKGLKVSHSTAPYRYW